MAVVSDTWQVWFGSVPGNLDENAFLAEMTFLGLPIPRKALIRCSGRSDSYAVATYNSNEDAEEVLASRWKWRGNNKHSITRCRCDASVSNFIIFENVIMCQAR